MSVDNMPPPPLDAAPSRHQRRRRFFFFFQQSFDAFLAYIDDTPFFAAAAS